ncbi:GNAT family N-acetyltransferase [Actinoplanes sp. HUAS TT8]|uniref:GNAT family N-acetyltransferase n=1 Tax=Actinoplanes sp. HUAS TT8 TaxID=3447453 RepID=UPI003F520BE6
MELLLDADAVRRRMQAADWATVAVDESGTVIGWGLLRSWSEADGTRVHLTDGYVAPPARRLGLGRRLLHEGERAATRLRAGHIGSGPVMLGGNASSVQPDRTSLLQRNGYRRVLTMIEMEQDDSSVRPRELPTGVTVRAATIDDAGPLVALSARAWAGRAFYSQPTEERLRTWLSRSQLDLVQVATAGDRVVGLVAVNRAPARTEIEDVQVDPDFQRRGLATAMMTRALGPLIEQGAGPIRLHTEGHDPAGARALYERLGFRVVREYHRYRKPLGPGAAAYSSEISVA